MDLVDKDIEKYIMSLLCLPRLGNNFLSWRLALSNLWYYDIMIIRKRTSQFEIIVKEYFWLV